MSTAGSSSPLSPLAHWVIRAQNRLIELVSPRRLHPSPSGELNEILERSRRHTDISDHLPLLFTEAMTAQPRLIVELGVATGESTFVLERVARLSGDIPLVSVDVEDCGQVCRYGNWHFVQAEDVEFAGRFPNWCAERKLPREIDVLFIDTSHLFDHTVQEWNQWFPLLSRRARVMFHDTNQKLIYRRRDGSWGIGWNNRGVTAAIEKMLDLSLDERRDFVEWVNGWIITHHAHCNGFTVMTRITAKPPEGQPPPH